MKEFITKEEARQYIEDNCINQQNRACSIFLKNGNEISGVFTANLEDSKKLFDNYKYRFIPGNKMKKFQESGYKDESQTVIIDCRDILIVN